MRPEDVVIPEDALSESFLAATGPGGQNVNKVASKIDLRVDLDAIEGLSDRARGRLHTLTVNRLDADGRLVVTSQESRDQSRNLEIAREKVRRLLAGVRGLRASGPVDGHDPVPGLPARSPPAGSPARLPEVRPARPAARGHRMVRALLTPPAGQAAAPRLPRLRRTAAPRRTGPVLALLAAPPGPPVRPGLEPGRPVAAAAGLAGRFHRPSRGPARPRPRLHHDHRAGPAAGR